jgi:proteasome lid subunit RPN8/RPN11
MAYFRRKARQCYPNEILAYLIGRQVNRGLIEVHYLYHPKLEHSSSIALKEADGEGYKAEQFAKDKSLVVVGDVHTHPDWPPVMSETDHHDHKLCLNKISAILSVPHKGRTHLVIWRDGTPLPCKIEYF